MSGPQYSAAKLRAYPQQAQRSEWRHDDHRHNRTGGGATGASSQRGQNGNALIARIIRVAEIAPRQCLQARECTPRSEEHTSELQSRENLVCRLLLEKK